MIVEASCHHIPFTDVKCVSTGPTTCQFGQRTLKYSPWNLDTKEQYQLRVRSQNIIGLSEGTEPLVSWIIPKPEKPLNLEIDPAKSNEREIALRWDEPDLEQPNNGPITGYRVLWRVQGSRQFNLQVINLETRSLLIKDRFT